MIIALDWDGTYTEDRELWNAFIHLAESRGHTIIIDTLRHEHEVCDDPPVKVYYTGHQGKAEYLAKKGIKPNIWIDDNPVRILKGKP